MFQLVKVEKISAEDAVQSIEKIATLFEKFSKGDLESCNLQVWSKLDSALKTVENGEIKFEVYFAQPTKSFLEKIIKTATFPHSKDDLGKIKQEMEQKRKNLMAEVSRLQLQIQDLSKKIGNFFISWLLPVKIW